jgi:hypothetical protein
MNLRRVSLSAVRQLQLELAPFAEQAKLEMKHPGTYSLGVLRNDLVEECLRRLTFITYMVKDTQEHPDGRVSTHKDQS